MRRRSPAAVRYLVLHRLAFGITALTVTLTAGATAATAAFATAAAAAGNRKTLSDNPASAILSTFNQRPFGPAVAEVTRQLTAAAPGLPMTFLSAQQSDSLKLPAGRGGPKALTLLLYQAQLRQHVRVVSGSWPAASAGSAGGLVPACIAAPAAKLLGLSAGDQLTLRDSISGSPARIRVACTYRELQPGSAYWQLDPVSTAGKSTLGNATSYGPLVTSQPPASWPVPAAVEGLLAAPDFATMTAGNLANLGDSLSTALSNMSSSQTLSVNITTNLPVLLGDQAVALEVARSQLLIGLLIVLVMAGASLAVVVRLLASQREGEPGLLMARGATRRQLAVRGCIDAALLATPAAILGPLLGIWLTPEVSKLSLAGTGAISLPATSPATAWAAGIAIAAGCAVIIAMPWLRQPPSPVRQRAGKGRQRSVTTVLSSGADIALVLLAVVAGWQLAGYSAPVSTGVSGGIGVDPILVAAPVLALTAGTLIMLRLLPLAVRLTERLAARGRGITVPVAAWMIGRRTMRQAGPALLMVLAVATSVIALAEGTSWRQSVDDQAGFTVGAATRINLASSSSLQIGQVADVAEAPGVRAATPVIRLPFTAPGGNPATLLAIDGKAAQRIVPLRSDLDLRPVRDPLQGISQSQVLTGGAKIPGRPTALQVLAKLTGHAVTQASLSLKVTDAAGVAYDLPAVGSLPADGARHRLVAQISGGAHADYPLTLTGFSLAYQMPDFNPTSKAALSIESVSSVSAGSRASQPMASLWTGTQQPLVRVSAPQMVGWTRNSAFGQPGQAALSAAGRGANLTFLTGAGSSAIDGSFVLGFESQAGAILSVAARTEPTLPGIATSAFLAASGQHLGGIVQISGLAVPLSVRIVGEMSQFPTISDAAGALIVNQAALQGVSEDSAAGALTVSEWWLQGSGRIPLSHLPAGATVTTETGVLGSLSSQPLSVAPLQALVAVAIVALALASLGCFVGVAAPRDRSRDLAVLDALGATPGQLTRLLCAEQAMLSVPAAAGGLALGLLLSRLIVPAVTLTPQAAQPIPSVLVRVPIAAALLIAVAVAALPVLAIAMSMLRGTSTMARLRAEEET